MNTDTLRPANENNNTTTDTNEITSQQQSIVYDYEEEEEEETHNNNVTESTPLLIKTSLKNKLKYYFPVYGWLPTYNWFTTFRKDLVAGITVSTLLIPQALSYSQALVHIPPVYGLYTCFLPLIIYSLMGTSRQLAIGPEALVSILVGNAIKEYHKSFDTPPEDLLIDSIAIANLLGLMVGLFTFMLGFFRLGFLDSVLSRALLRGFITAVALVVCIDMANTIFGLVDHENDTGIIKESPIEQLINIVKCLGESHVLTTIISLSSIAFCYIARFLKSRYAAFRHFPEILVLVFMSTLFSYLFRWDQLGVSVLQDVKGGLIAPSIPKDFSLQRIDQFFLSAVLIAVIGFVESIVVSKTYASIHNYSVSPNRELVALGLGNIIASFFGSYPAFGSLGRSSVAHSAGAQTQMAGFISGIFVLITTVSLLPLFYFLPRAVCSAIIVVAALNLIEVHDLYLLWQLGAWNDVFLLALTFLSTLFISIEVGTLLSVGISLLLVVKHTAKTRIDMLGKTKRGYGYKTKFRSLHDRGVYRIPGVMIVRIQEGLFFGNCTMLKERLKRAEMHGVLGVHPGEMLDEYNMGNNTSNTSLEIPQDVEGSQESLQNATRRPIQQRPLSLVVFDAEAMTIIDASAIQTLHEIVAKYKERSIKVCFVKVREECLPNFIRSEIADMVGHDAFFDKIRSALVAYGIDKQEEESNRDSNYLAPPSRNSVFGANPGGIEMSRQFSSNSVSYYPKSEDELSFNG